MILPSRDNPDAAVNSTHRGFVMMITLSLSPCEVGTIALVPVPPKATAQADRDGKNSVEIIMYKDCLEWLHRIKPTAHRMGQFC